MSLDSYLGGVCYDHHWAHELEAGLENMFDRLVDDDDEVGPSGAPFCGCSTCFLRETLVFVLPAALEAKEMGLLHLTKEGCCS